MKNPVITKSDLMAILDQEKLDIQTMKQDPYENNVTFSVRKSHALGELRAVRGRILDYFREQEEEV